MEKPGAQPACGVVAASCEMRAMCLGCGTALVIVAKTIEAHRRQPCADLLQCRENVFQMLTRRAMKMPVKESAGNHALPGVGSSPQAIYHHRDRGIDKLNSVDTRLGDDGRRVVDMGRCRIAGARHVRRPCALLHHMRQLVRKQTLSRFAPGCILAGPKDNVSSKRKSPGIDRCGEPRRRLIGMNVHPAEIVAESRFHRSAYGLRQRLAATL